MPFPILATKDPSAEKTYTYDFADWLESGETIVSHTVTVPSGITKISDSKTATAVKVTLSAGTIGESYDIMAEIVTNASPAQTEQRTFTVPVDET